MTKLIGHFINTSGIDQSIAYFATNYTDIIYFAAL